MFLKYYVVGDVQTNCYIAAADISKSCVVIDPGDEAEYIMSEAAKLGYTIDAIILTHGHFDHIQANDILRDKTGAPLGIHADDGELLETPEKAGSDLFGQFHGCRPPELLLHNGDTIAFGPYQLRVIYTPGHSKGGCCFYEVNEKVCFTGDTLFRGSIGRTDLYGGNYATLLKSVRERLQVLADDTTIYPGHGPESNMAFERRANQYLCR